VDHEPDLLLRPLTERVAGFAGAQRFEEAAWARDRHRAVVRALDRRRAWLALQTAGRVEAEREGEHAVIDGGRLLAAWSGDDVPLLPPATSPTVETVAPSVLAQEEADLIWKWLTASGTRLVDVAGPLDQPRQQVTPLENLPGEVVLLGSAPQR
jgi:hypothetical protein